MIGIIAAFDMEILKASPVPQENIFPHTTDLPVDGCDLPGPENQVSQEDAWWGDIPVSAPGGPVPKVRDYTIFFQLMRHANRRTADKASRGPSEPC